MGTASKWAIVVLSVAGLGIFSVAPTIADPTTQPSSSDTQSNTQTGTGTITGTVTKDGKPLPNARVGLTVKPQRVKGKKAGRKNSAANTNSATTQPSETGEKHHHPQPLMTATTDSNGKFTLTDVKPGDYVIIAGIHGEARGHERIAVTSGQTATVEIPVNVPGEKNGDKQGGAAKLGI